MADPAHPTRRGILRTPLPLSLAAGGAVFPAPAEAGRRADRRSLVAYFSRSGNTRVIAGQISRTLQADLFEITPIAPYPDDYFETVAQAQQERDRGYQPQLAATVVNIAQYPVLFLGFPIWGTTVPPVIRSFLVAHGLAGKTIIPFITHGGYGLGDSLAVVARLASQARLVEGYSMQAPQERQTIERVEKWLAELDATD